MMIGLPAPNGLSAPRSYGNPHNLSRPRVANNRSGSRIGITKRPPNFMPQPPQRIGVQQQPAPNFGGGMFVPQSLPQQQPMMPPQRLASIPPPPVQSIPAMQFPPQPQPPFMRRGQPNLSFGRQYYE